MKHSQQFSRRLFAAVIALLLIAALNAQARQMAAASFWYLQVRYDAPNYQYSNAMAEISDPANVAWIIRVTP